MTPLSTLTVSPLRRTAQFILSQPKLSHINI